MAKNKLTLCQPVKLHHPTSPATGWSASILLMDGYIFARVYGRTEDQCRERAAKVFEAVSTLNGTLS